MRVYIAKFKLGDKTYTLEANTQENPTKEEIDMALEALNGQLPPEGEWVNQPSSSAYFLK